MTYIIRLLCSVSLVLLVFTGVTRAESPCVGVYYGHDLPEEALYLYDWLIVDPDSFSMEALKERFYIKNRRARLIAYVSVGELEPQREYFKDASKEWFIGENRAWGTTVVDLRKPAYRRFLLERVVKPAMEQGFDGVFLDTLDSYRLALKEDEWAEYEKAELELIQEIRRRYPSRLIVINRGFELLDSVHHIVDAILVEGLFYGIDTEKMTYREVPEEERGWLVERLEKAKRYGLPVIVLDYIEPSRRELAREAAKRIARLGFIPYISDYELSTIGVGNCELIPRRVLLLYNSDVQTERSLTEVHRFVQLPLEYLGFVPVLYDIKNGLPEGYLADRYAGAVVWVGRLIDYRAFHKWTVEKIKEGLRIFFIDDFGFPAERKLLEPLGIGLISSGTLGLRPLQVKKTLLPFFEAEPSVASTVPALMPSSGRKVLVVEDEDGTESVPFAITPWGGYALDGALIVKEFEAWVYDPFEVLKEVFPRRPVAVPDVTTENGRRILTAHIDGDSFFGNADFDATRNLGEIVRDEILERFSFPHTVSVIEGELAPWGLYPEKAERLEEVARSIFALPNVEPASHSWSHPFYWKALIYGTAEAKEVRYNLSIQGYRFSLERDIEGSIKYINKRLVPEDKPVRVFLWTGDCLPNEEALRMTYRLGVYNVNGGDTHITRVNPFLVYVSPMGVNRGEHFQVYSPVQNENLYTNEWTGPYYGYSNVIQTFELTDSPRRLKPVGIYYHFYSAQKIASLRALKSVYRWAMEQKLNPMFLSEYAQRVLEFRTMAFARLLDGGLVVRADSSLKTLRIDREAGFPDLERSRGIVGYMERGDVIYLHLDGSGDYKIVLKKDKPEGFRLIESNGQVVLYERKDGSISIGLRSYMPLEFSIEKTGCTVSIEGGEFETGKKEKEVFYRLPSSTKAVIRARCKGQVR